MDKNKTWYNPKVIFKNWQYVMKMLDKIFHDCNIFCSNKKDNDYIDYDLIQHSISIKKGGSYNRVRFVAAMIEMIIFNLAPGSWRVKYNGENYLLISRLNIFKMAGIIAHKLYPDMTDKWLDWVKKQEHEQKELRKSPIISKSDLSHMYYDKGLTCKQIADIVGKNFRTVHNWMNAYGLSRRSNHIYISPQKLDDLYYNQDFTLKEIAKIFDVDFKTILQRMKDYNMPRRDRNYTVPFHNNRTKAFRSALRKKFRRNFYYIEVAREVIKEIENDPKFCGK